MAVEPKFLVPGGLLVLTYALGFWLTALGRPYQGALFNAHKLVALAAVVLAARATYLAVRPAETHAAVSALAVIAVACVVALFATGALMSAGTAEHGPLLAVHRIVALVLPLATAPLVALLVAS